jgi:hypothetical protein
VLLLDPLLSFGDEFFDFGVPVPVGHPAGRHGVGAAVKEAAHPVNMTATKFGLDVEGVGASLRAPERIAGHSTVPLGTTHWQRWPVTDAIRSKSAS